MAELVIATAHGAVRAEADLSRRTKLTIGASPKCDVCVEGGSISRHHALLIEEGGVWIVLDLSATHGLWNGAERLRAAAVREGAPIRMGDLFLWFYGVHVHAALPLPSPAARPMPPAMLRAELLEALWRDGAIAPRHAMPMAA